jgi:hypothetical protein
MAPLVISNLAKRRRRGDNPEYFHSMRTCLWILTHHETDLERVNEIRKGTECVSKEEAMHLKGTTIKTPITKEQYDNDLIVSPFSKYFLYEKNTAAILGQIPT